MLSAMLTASLAAAAPWQVPVVVALVVAGAVLIAAALAAAARSTPRSWRSFPDDDLPRFAAAPPGCDGPSPGRGATTRSGLGAATVVLAVAGVLALLAAAALTVVVATHAERAPAARAAQPQTARLSFGGVVLEQRAVGVTVTYPDVTVRVGPGPRSAVAHVRLPTFNCLADAPPADPAAAGCVRSLEEFADLATPQLAVVRENNGSLRLSGRFATYTRPNGSPPEYTGRVYALEFRVGSGRTTAAGAGLTVQRFRG
jgi:hypothetical protein